MRRFLPAPLGLLLPCALWAQAVPPPPDLAALPPARPAAAPPADATRPAPAPAASGAGVAAALPGAARVRVVEDDQVRIEETFDARGRLQRIAVHSKTGGKSYEIIVPPGGQDPSQQRGSSGQRAWSLFDF